MQFIQKVVLETKDNVNDRAVPSSRLNLTRFTGVLPAGTEVTHFKNNPIVLSNGKPAGIMDNFHAASGIGGGVSWFGDFKVAPVGEGAAVAALMQLGVGVLEPVIGREGLRNFKVVSVSTSPHGATRTSKSAGQSELSAALARSAQILASK